MTRFRVLAWHGIPAQVKAGQEGQRSASVQLDPWFTEHIDRVLMRPMLRQCRIEFFDRVG